MTSVGLDSQKIRNSLCTYRHPKLVTVRLNNGNTVHPGMPLLVECKMAPQYKPLSRFLSWRMACSSIFTATWCIPHQVGIAASVKQRVRTVRAAIYHVHICARLTLVAPKYGALRPFFFVHISTPSSSLYQRTMAVIAARAPAPAAPSTLAHPATSRVSTPAHHASKTPTKEI